jgi:arsenite/tail-anchored protein-transporting ATPase
MTDTLSELLQSPVRFYFFTGKGGVGKTSLACATAVGLADRGRRTLLVSTDPASNLDAVLGVSLGNTPVPVPGAPHLLAMNIDPDAAARDYRERTIAPYRGAVPDAELAQIEEQLAGACTVEVAAFDEFTVLLGQDELMRSVDHVVFDTAPTGHTLRLLQLPAAWSGYLDTSSTAVSCLGPLAGLKAQQARYQEAVRTLGDAGATTLVLVGRPDRVALLEAERTRTELGALGMQNQVLVINALFRATDGRDPLALAVEERANKALADMPAGLRTLRRVDVPMRGFNIVGLPMVRAFLNEPAGQERRSPEPGATSVESPPIPSLASIVEELAASDHGLVMVMGKGGVGKTTIAAAIAVALADRGRPVLLTTTDPAAHVTETLAVSIPGLSVSRIDPVAEARRYRDETYASKARGLDAEHRALLHEELRSPCYDEIAFFVAFSKIVVRAKRELVVVDTAPTGHTLRLLDTAGSYHRQLVPHDPKPGAPRFVTPLMLLRNPDVTKVVIVTLAETTPVLEAQALQEDLRQAGIEPFAWVINASLLAAHPSDPVLQQRAHAEAALVRKVAAELAQRVALVPFQLSEPTGSARLRELVAAHHSPSRDERA